MAHSLSATKRIRQNEKRKLRNRSRTSGLLTKVKLFNKAVDEKDAKAAETVLKSVYKSIDQAASSGLIKMNTAARKKSRLTQKLNAIKK